MCSSLNSMTLSKNYLYVNKINLKVEGYGKTHKNETLNVFFSLEKSCIVDTLESSQRQTIL